MMEANTGRYLWSLLHRFADDADKDAIDQAYFLKWWMGEVDAQLGCRSCFQKVSRFCQLWPIDYGKGLSLWAKCLHDYVNKELGKPLFCPDLTLAPLLARGIIQ